MGRSELSFLRNYLKYATANEAPEMFHVLAGYFCLSTAVSRKVWLPFADDFVYPNIYVMFVGQAGNGKTEALMRAKRVLAGLDIPLSGSIETPEGMWRYMAGEPTAKPPIESAVKKSMYGPRGEIIDYYPMAIVASEFINFISQNPEGWIAALNDIFDCNDYKYRTKNKGTDCLPNPYITMLGALTTETASSLQKQNILNSGLARRTFMQWGERQWDDPRPWPLITPEEAAARDAAIAHLRVLQGVTGRFELTDNAKEWWDTWYRGNHELIRSVSPTLKSWYGTKAARLMELAMLTALSEGTALIVDAPHFQVAHDYLVILEDDLPRIFGAAGRNELAGVATMIYDYVSSLPEPVTSAHVKHIFFQQCRPPTEFEDCVNYLVETKQLGRHSLQVGLEWQVLLGRPDQLAAMQAKVAARPNALIGVSLPTDTARVTDP